MLSTLSLAAFALFVPGPPLLQTSADLKLKLREDETVRYRSMTNIVTYSPDGMEERVVNGLYSFTFGAEKEGTIPISAKIESMEGMDQGTNDGSGAIASLSLNFEMDKKGVTTPTTFRAPLPALDPVGKLVSTMMDGTNALGFLGFTFPDDERTVVGKTWTKKVSGSKFLAPVYGVAGDVIKIEGELDAVFTLVDVVNVNKKSHARVSVQVTGKCSVDIHTPELELSGVMDLKSMSGLLIDLSTGLLTRAKTDTSADIDFQVAQAQIEVLQLVYRKP